MQYHYDTPSGGQFFADAYLMYYKLDLWTNFTFFLDDPVNGDGINQQDQRYMYGGNLGYRQAGELFGIHSAATVGFQVRDDSISNIRLGTQTKRTPTGTIVQSAVQEASYSPYVKLELQPMPWMRLAGGVRADYFTFDVRNLCDTCPEQPAGRKDSGQVSPKANLILGPWFNTEFFANYGTGFPQQRCAIDSSGREFSSRQGTGRRNRPSFQTLGPGSNGIDRDVLGAGFELRTRVRGRCRNHRSPWAHADDTAWRWAHAGRSMDRSTLTAAFTWTHAEFKERASHSPGARINRVRGIDPAMAGRALLAIANDLSRSQALDRGSYGQSTIVARL